MNPQQKAKEAVEMFYKLFYNSTGNKRLSRVMSKDASGQMYHKIIEDLQKDLSSMTSTTQYNCISNNSVREFIEDKISESKTILTEIEKL